MVTPSSHEEPVRKAEVPQTVPIAPPPSQLLSSLAPTPQKAIKQESCPDVVDKGDTQPISVPTPIPVPIKTTPSSSVPATEASKAETKPLPELSGTSASKEAFWVQSALPSSPKISLPKDKYTNQAISDTSTTPMIKAPRRQKWDWRGITAPTEFIFDNWAKWVVRVLAILFVYLDFPYGCFRFYNIGTCAAGCMFFALSFKKRIALVCAWAFALWGSVAFFWESVVLYLWRGWGAVLWPVWIFVEGSCFLLFLVSLIAKNKRIQNSSLWILCAIVLIRILNFPVCLYDPRISIFDILRCVFFIAICSCMIFATHRQVWWQERLLQLDNIRVSTKTSGKDVLVDAPEYKYLKFFVPCCWGAVALVLVIAIVGFTVTVEINTGWRHKVRLFTMLSFISGNSDNAWWQYWLLVLIECLHIGTAALYASSVLSTLQSNAAIVESLHLYRTERNEVLNGLGLFIKFIGFVIALICLFACIAFFNEWDEDGIGLVLMCIIAGGALTIATYGWGSIFCAQAWNEGIAKQAIKAIQDDKAKKHLEQEQADQTQSKQKRFHQARDRREAECIHCRLKLALRYRELAIQVGAGTMCPDILVEGDCARDKAIKESVFEVADDCCTVAKTAYRNACVSGADKMSQSYADIAKTAFLQRKWQEAKSAAKEALAFDPVNAEAARIIRKTFWKRGGKTAKAGKS